MSATIKYKGNTIASITTDSSKTLKTSGKYCEGDIVVENVQDGGITPSGNKAITATTSTQTGIDVTNYATVSVAPTPSETKSVTTNGDVTPSSGKLLSKVTVNVPTGTARDSSDLTVSGATVNVPAGLYSSAASKSVASGTAGTPTASKSAVSNNSVTVTPSVTNTEGYITGGTKTGTGVKVSASELVSGNKAITPSETAQSGIDVTNFKTASVGAISSTYVGSGVTRKAAATVAPSTSEQTVCASGVYTTGEQKVSAITKELLASLDADFIADNIKKDVDLFGLIGTLEAGGGGGDFDFSLLGGVNFVKSGSFTPAQDTFSVFVTDNDFLTITPKLYIIYTESVLTITDKYLPLAIIQADISDDTGFVLGVWTKGLNGFSATSASYTKPFNFNATSSVTTTNDYYKFSSSNTLCPCSKISQGFLARASSYRGNSSSYAGYFEAGSTYNYVYMGVK